MPHARGRSRLFFRLYYMAGEWVSITIGKSSEALEMISTGMLNQAFLPTSCSLSNKKIGTILTSTRRMRFVGTIVVISIFLSVFFTLSQLSSASIPYLRTTPLLFDSYDSQKETKQVTLQDDELVSIQTIASIYIAATPTYASSTTNPLYNKEKTMVIPTIATATALQTHATTAAGASSTEIPTFSSDTQDVSATGELTANSANAYQQEESKWIYDYGMEEDKTEKSDSRMLHQGWLMFCD